jgi:hypothetical protein
LNEKGLDMGENPFHLLRLEMPAEKLAKKRLQNAPRNAPIRTHEVDKILLEQRQPPHRRRIKDAL